MDFNSKNREKGKKMIMKCTCKHEGQDKLHGTSNRVFNELDKKGGTESHYRCTVCLKEKIKDRIKKEVSK